MSGNEPDLKLRNFIVDYRDKDDSYYHSVHQIACASIYTDAQVIATLKGELEGIGYTVIFIVEAFGRFNLEEMQRIVNSPDEMLRLSIEPKCIDVVEVRKVAV